MAVLAFFNLKGGVGKTSSCVNLAHLAARDGYRILVWDLDPQGAAGCGLGVCETETPHKAKKLLKHSEELEGQILHTDWPNLDVLPAMFGFRHMDVMLGDGKKASKRLRKVLEHIGADYDHIFLDCPPSISVLSESIFSVADYTVMPLLPTEYSRRAFEQVVSHMQESKYATSRVVAFYNLVDRRKSLHRTTVLKGVAAQPELFCESSIPARSDIERMPLEQRPVTDYAPKSDSAFAYGVLWRELRGKLGLSSS